MAVTSTLKSILKQRKNYGNSNISPCQKIYLIFKKNPLKQRNQNPSRYYYNSIITNLKFQHKAKISSFKNPHIKMDLLLITQQGPKSIKLVILNNESQHNILALVCKANNICKKNIHILSKNTCKQKIFLLSRTRADNMHLRARAFFSLFWRRVVVLDFCSYAMCVCFSLWHARY